MAKKRARVKQPVLADDVVLRAAKRMMLTQSTLESLIDQLIEARKEWSKRVRAARNELASALSEAQVDPNDPADVQAQVGIIMAQSADMEAARLERKRQGDLANVAWEHIAAAIEGTAPGNSAVMQRIARAYQEQIEAEAGRKAALHMLLLDQEEMQARARKQVEGARQLGLFDGVETSEAQHEHDALGEASPVQ